MLVVVMHNNKEYLELLNRLAKTEGINRTTVIDRKKLGTQLVGTMANITVSRGRRLDAYDKAFLALVQGEARTQHFLEQIENNEDLNLLNLQDRGFICTVPFNRITDFTLKTLDAKKEDTGVMKIVDLLMPQSITLNLQAQNKTDAINELAALLKGRKEVNNLDTFIKDVFERESLNSTGIGDGVAVPHARTDEVNDFVIAFGRSAGIEFDAIDKKPAKLIFLMGTPKGKGINNYLKILAKLTRLLSKAELKELLYAAKNVEEAINAFKHFEQDE